MQESYWAFYVENIGVVFGPKDCHWLVLGILTNALGHHVNFFLGHPVNGKKYSGERGFMGTEQRRVWEQVHF